MPGILLTVGVLSFAATANASRPTRLRLLMMPSFVMSWLIIEFAGSWLAVAAATVAVLAAGGGLHGWAGWAGVSLMTLTMAGLSRMVALSGRTSVTLRAAGAPPGGPVRFPSIHVVFPFLVTRRRGVRRITDVVFAEAGGDRLRLDIYLPNGSAGMTPGVRAAPGVGDFPRPGILQIHGGDWSHGDKRSEAIPLLRHLAAAGWVCLAANYRLSPKVAFPAHVEDVKRAIAWYREHAEEFGADPGFLAITGGSAGAHLAALAALTPHEASYQPGFEEVDTSLRAAVVWYGAYDFTNRLATWAPHEMRMLERAVMQRSLAADPAAFSLASPIDRVMPDAPPFFVLHGDIDTLAPVAEAREFVARLRRVSRQPVLYTELAGAQHAFDVLPSHRCARCVEAAERFLTGVHRTYLAGECADAATGSHDGR